MHLDVMTLASLGENNLWSSIQRAEGENNLWGLIQRAEGGCEAGRLWFT